MFNPAKNHYLKNIYNLIPSTIFPWLITALGIILYLRQYLINRSLWLDEAMVSLDIIQQPVSSFLHQPLPHDQAAPFGFLIIEKLFLSLGGTGEYVLRLYPLIAGLISLWLFSRWARIYLNAEFAALALFTFVITPSLVYFSSEVKPYGTDVFFALLSYVVIAEPCLKKLDWSQTGGLGLLGAIIIWFSYPIIFILYGICIPLLLFSVIQRDRSQLLKLGVIVLYWSIGLILYYIFLLHHFTHITYGEDMQSGMISLTDYRSWLRVLNDAFRYPVGTAHYLRFAKLFFFLGGYSFFKKDKRIFFILMSPLLLVLLACGLHIYPFLGRLVLFLVPIFLLMIAKGIGMISLKTGRWKIITAFLLTGILFYDSCFFTFKEFMAPQGNEEIRTVMSYVKKNIKPGDVLFIYYAARPAFEYYNFIRGFSFNNYIEEQKARNQPSKWVNDLNKLHGSKRVWILFSHVWDSQINGMNEAEYFLHYLSTSGGQMLDSSSSHGAAAYLFNLSHFYRDL
ncbi:MAG: glycosyltransferase family 39 protein [Candidatus Omnitrophica bacterium]|nr:glycosyltransferase family 39 protein [Candidatus Omnitrophota bacterium]